MTYLRLSPFDGKLAEAFDSISATEYETKLAAAQACFETWRHTTYADWAMIITKAAKLLHEHVGWSLTGARMRSAFLK